MQRKYRSTGKEKRSLLNQVWLLFNTSIESTKAFNEVLMPIDWMQSTSF